METGTDSKSGEEAQRGVEQAEQDTARENTRPAPGEGTEGS